MSTNIKWGIIGLGMIARTFANGLKDSKTGKLVAVASRSQESADKFGQEFGADARYDDYEKLLADDNVDAVYIATPHPLHPEWAIKAARAGKHILCEKPIGLNAAAAEVVIEAAIENDVFLMEAFMYRCHPQITKLIELIQEKAIGDVRHIDAVFSFNANVPPTHRLVNNDLGGGGILDVGCYPVSMSRLISGVANGGQIAEPIELKAVGHLGETGVDLYACAAAKFPGGITAQLTTGVNLALGGYVKITGSQGNIQLPNPWIPAREGGTVNIILTKQGEEPQNIEITTDKHLYSFEADILANNLDKRQASFPAMSHADTLGNMRTLDMWRQSIGLVYNQEQPENITQTVTGQPLAIRGRNNMKYAEVPFVDKQVARLVMGCDNQATAPHAFAMFDDYIERGGNCFDTAHIYGGGKPETFLGQWMINRNLRDRVVVIGKGAHTPNCYPEKLTEQLLISLERLQSDYVDIYFMHRDNLDIPVSEFVDVLNEHVAAGRIKCFGGSNWTMQRIDEANAYAQANNKQGFSVLSNNFSLARMVEAPWPGCLASSDATWRKWLTENQMPLMPWSSQASGFFTDRGDPGNSSDPIITRCWQAEDNFTRRERAIELAAKKGVQPISIALAYILAQPFPTFPLIGPRHICETRTSFEALTVELNPEEIAWLNLDMD